MYSFHTTNTAAAARDDDLIQELKGVGLSPDQIFQLLTEREKTNQKNVELLIEKEKSFQKQLESEENSKKKRKHTDSQSSPSSYESDNPSSSKKVCNQFPNRKSLQDLCTDELVTILDFIPDYGSFKLARVSKQFNQIVLNNIKRVHLINVEEDVDANPLKNFINSRYFHNIESLIIDHVIPSHLVKKILINSDNLRELKIYPSNSDGNSHYLQSCYYPHSSFKKLETLRICAVDEDFKIKLDHINLFNLTDLYMESVNCNVSDYLNDRVNNIKKLNLTCIKVGNLLPRMMLTHLKLDECEISPRALYGLLVDTLEHVSIGLCECIEHQYGVESKLESPLSFPYLKTLNISNSGEFDFTPLFKSSLPNLTDLSLDDLTESYAKALSENRSITSLKKLAAGAEKDCALKILMESKTLFKEIDNFSIHVEEQDSNILLFMSNNASSLSNLKVLELTKSGKGGLKGYQSFFTSEHHFNNLEKLTIRAPSQKEDLNYLAQTTCFPNLKNLFVIGKIEKPENFFSLFSSNSNYRQLRELDLSFLDDSSITHIKSMENLKTIRICKSKITGRGVKQLDEWGVAWSL